MADGMVEWREWQEWRNGRKNGRMAEWQNGRNGYIRTIYGIHQRRYQKQRRHLLIFYIIRLNGGMAELQNGGMVIEWRNGGMARMVIEWRKWWNGGMVEWRNGGRNGGMAERMAEWSNGGNGYLHTIYGTRRQRHFNLL